MSGAVALYHMLASADGIVTALTLQWTRLSLITSAAAAVGFRTLSDFDFSSIHGERAGIGQVWLDALALVLQRDRYYFTVYSALGSVALAALLVAFYLLIARRIDADWALALTLLGAMATPLAITLIFSARVALTV